MGLPLVSLAAVCAALSSFFARRSIDVQGSAYRFFAIQYFFSFLVALLFFPLFHKNLTWSAPLAIIGSVAGVCQGLLGIFLSRALMEGPSGLTFAALNCACVLPGLLLALLFGEAFGCTYTRWNAIGSLLVILGICWAGWSNLKSGNQRKWALYIIPLIVMQILVFVIFQWRALLVTYPLSASLFVPLHPSEINSPWFAPAFFLWSFLVSLTYLFIVKRGSRTTQSGEACQAGNLPSVAIVTSQDIKVGFLGGLFNGLATLGLILGAEYASPALRPTLFPLFSVGVILCCNIWSRRIYQERVNWGAIALCLLGIAVGSLRIDTRALSL